MVRFARDERGQDLVEYALVTGIIGIVGVLLFPTFADRMRTAYLNWQSNTQAIWEPCPPSPASCP